MKLSNQIVLYDGVCGLCNRLNRFLLNRDRHDLLRFASLQSPFAATVLRHHNLDPTDLDTVYVVVNHGEKDERVLARSDAIIHVVSALGGVWKLSTWARLLPKFLRDGLYTIIAKIRYRFFGKADSCLIPDPRHRQKFIEV